MMYKNRKQQRRVVEKMDSLLFNLKGFMTDDMKECIMLTHDILIETPIATENKTNLNFDIRKDSDRFICSVCKSRDNTGSKRDTTQPVDVKEIKIGELVTALCYNCRRLLYNTLYQDLQEVDDGK